MNRIDAIGEEDVARFASLLEQNFGLYFGGPDLPNLTLVLGKRIEATASSNARSHLQRLQSRWREELRSLASLLTVTESYFFRNPEHLTIVVETAIPELRRTDRTRPIRIVSAGCASGEEPFSIAIALLEQSRIDPAGISILGFDLNPLCVARARAGRCSPWALRALPERLIEKYFKPCNGELVISDRIRAMVEFEERNLMDPDWGFWGWRGFEVIFCRNVLMYLSPHALQQVVRTFARSLVPDRYLFLGHAESLHGISRDFLLKNSHGAFYYCPRAARIESTNHGNDERPGKPPLPATPARSLRSPAPAPRELRATSAAASGRSHSTRNDDEKCAAKELSGPISLTEALAIIDQLPPERRDDPDVVLLTAALLSERGKLEHAEELCNSLLAADNLNPAAHYLKARCRERKGDRESAAQGYRTAIYLDADFAMPHLRLGLALKRAGELETARAEFEQALLLLGREDPARLLLFAGGRSREALLDLCRRELRDCGGIA